MSSDIGERHQVTAVAVGAGERGNVYAGYACLFPAQMKVVAVAEPRDYYRKKMGAEHSLAEV
jgi:hypothetical protein